MGMETEKFPQGIKTIYSVELHIILNTRKSCHVKEETNISTGIRIFCVIKRLLTKLYERK